MPVRGILFDKDGTLIDFRRTWLAAYRGAAADLAAAAGLDPGFAGTLLKRSGYDALTDSFAETSPLLWATNRAIAEDWAAAPELADLTGAVAIAEAHFGDEARYPPVPVGDLSALFGRLRGRGLGLGVATMDTTAKARSLLAGLGLEGQLDFVTGFDGGFGEKPEPGMVLGFCAALGLAPEEVVVVGDTAADLLMARAAGAAMAVAVLTGATPRAALDRHADRVIDSVMAIEALLDGGR
jgi:phosphoglycolate phosphatase